MGESARAAVGYSEHGVGTDDSYTRLQVGPLAKAENEENCW